MYVLHVQCPFNYPELNDYVFCFVCVEVWVSSLVPCGVNGVQKRAKDTALWHASFESDNERGRVCDCSVCSLFISLLRLVEIWPELKSTNSTLK